MPFFMRCAPLACALLLAACGGGQSNGGATNPPAPTVTLSASSTAIHAGDQAMLTWTSTGATSCTASGAWSGALAVSGTQSTGALTKSANFAITCTGAGGTSPAASVTVNIVPNITFSADRSSVAPGGSAQLSWNASNATGCTASGGWSGNLATSGSQSTGPLSSPATYDLSCSGPGGTTSAPSITVNVSPTVTFKTSAAAINSGTSATLSWSSSNATACSASGAWSGARAASGSTPTGSLASSATYSLVCTGPGGSSSLASVTVNIIPTVTLTATPKVVVSGGSATLTWSSANATSCSASGSWSGAKAPSGSQSMGSLSSAQNYALSCSGAGGQSAPASAAVNIQLQSKTTPAAAAITLTRAQAFGTSFTGNPAISWSVDGIIGGNPSIGTISATGVYSAGSAAGPHTISALSADQTQLAQGMVAVTDLAGVYTYHNTLARNGVNAQEYALTKSNVNNASFGKRTSCAVDGAIYAQPLWVANLTVNGAVHNVVFVATQHDSLYAFDADAVPCVKLWSVSLIDAAHGGSAPGGSTPETSVPNTLVGSGYGDIAPEIGVTGTPVIDPSTNILYIDSKSVDSTQHVFYHRLHAIDLGTGSEKSSPALVQGSVPGSGDGGTTVTFNARQQNQRAGLALVNGTVYMAFSSHEDAAPWYGWMFAYRYGSGGFTQTAVFNSTPNHQQGGIWMGGGAPPVDANNNLYVVTGNGMFDASSNTAPNNDYGDSLLKLTPALTVAQYFTPTDESTDYSNDADFGSGGAAVLADLPAGNSVTHALVCGGKDQFIFVINRDLLGGFGDTAAVQKINLGHSIFATGALFNNGYYIAGLGGPLSAFSLNTSNAQFTLSSTSAHVYGFPGSTPSISAAGTANGIVWSIDSSSYCTPQSGSCGPSRLYAYDAANVATELWDSTSLAGNAAGNAVKFTVPTVANGRVYIGTRGNNAGGADSSTTTPGELEIYGLLP